ncbi:hypothetical protein GGI12_002993 [Dipsacomyces acuminosporus]|nr:hypothetical protein GGI12_002993 [Dipsacomyces acuminosporus]
MDNDTFNSFINQALVDPSSLGSSNTNDFGKASSSSMLGNELFLQLLLNATTAPTAADPSTLGTNSVLASDAFMAPTDATSDADAVGTADSNTMLTAALLSALSPSLPDSVSPIDMQSTIEPESMLVDDLLQLASETAQTTAPSQVLTGSANRHNGVKMANDVVSANSSIATTATTRTNAAATARQQPSAAAVKKETTSTAAASPRSIQEECESGSLEADEMRGVDMKNLTSKERRQLRNKISARNFRVRRKEYITNLEAEVRMHKEEADGLRKDLASSKKENLQLREEIQRLRLKLNSLSISSNTAVSSSAATAASANTMSAASVTTASSNTVPLTRMALPTTAQQQPVKLPAASVVRFNPHKDVGQAAAKKAVAGSSAGTGNWAAKNTGSGFITVNTALLPTSQVARSEELLREARRKQAVDALLSMREETTDAESLLLNDVATRTAALGIANLVAEIVLSQFFAESSISVSQSDDMAVPTLLSMLSC